MRLWTASVAVVPHVAAALLLAAQPRDRAPSAPRDEARTLVVGSPPARAPETRAAPPRDEPARTLTMTLEHGEAVPEGHPNTWVHLPATHGARELALTFVFHGFKNCIESYTGAGTHCRRDHDPRPGYELAAQLEREGSSSIVVVPETSFDTESAEAPALAMHGAFRAYVGEVLAALAPEVGEARLEDVRRVALVASSGGYQALEPILADAGPLVTDVLLLDAGYMYPNSTVGRFLGTVSAELAAGASAHRLGILYTPGGGALHTSFALREIAERAAGGLARVGRFRTDPPLDALRAPLYVYRVDEEHDVVVRRNMGRVLAAAGL